MSIFDGRYSSPPSPSQTDSQYIQNLIRYADAMDELDRPYHPWKYRSYSLEELEALGKSLDNDPNAT